MFGQSAATSKQTAQDTPERIRLWGIIAMVGWSLLLALSLAVNIADTLRETMDLAKLEARANFNKDQAFRFWATRHGGVYVPINERTPPNPYLAHIPERDVTTPSGVRLTLMNPAYMVRQLMEEFSPLYGIKGRITSLKPLRPENAPDEWEKKALLAFEQGVEEVSEITDIDGKQYLRLMRRMETDPGCLKCHAHQGYKVGDIRGGVGVNVPLAPFMAAQTKTLGTLAASHGGLWVFGLSLIYFTRRSTLKRAIEKAQSDEALEASEERLRSFLNHSSAAVFIKDNEGRFQLVNRRWETLFGVKADEIQGKTDFDIFPEDMARRFTENDREVLDSLKPIEFEEEAPQPDGTHTYIVMKFPILGPDGKAQGLGGVATDITERKAAEAALRQTNAELEQFAYVASHDLREPLRMISSYVSLLEKRYGPQLDKDGLDFIFFAKDGAQRMDRLILDLLDYSRVGRICHPFAAMDSCAAVQEALTNLSLAIQESGAKITVPDDMPSILGSYDEIVRLFQNLIGNAIKYRSKDKPCEIVVEAKPIDGVWRFSIKDNGIGINQQFQDRIFHIFQRLHARDDYGGGSGIGLAICKKIVERHGGRIWVESDGVTGSRFSFTLPAVTAAERSL